MTDPNQASSGRAPQAAGTAGAKSSPDANAAAATDSSTAKRPFVPAQVATRTARFMVASRPVPGQLQPMAVDTINEALDGMPGVTVVRRLTSRGLGVLSAGPGSGAADVIVAEMTPERGEALRANAPPGVIVERDLLLGHAGPARDSFALLDAEFPVVGQPQRISADVMLRVVGKDGRPVPKAKVMVYGQDFPAQGVTDSKGEVTVNVTGGTIDTIRALFVKPSADFWDRVIMRPALVDGQANVITLQSLGETFPGFPDQPTLGWGQKLMGLDRIDPRFRGAGIKIGIIDSGCDNSHPQLRHVANGADLVLKDKGNGWTNDELAHGTHCAGIIGARCNGSGGIVGFAPDAEIHALKVFPGGRFSDLIDALDVALDRQLDVLNMSLGTAEASELVQHKLAAVVDAGIACIVASGNSAGAVQFPGSAPQSITIGAIGQSGQFPDDSDHAYTLPPEGAGPTGLYSAKFSCFGPQVRLCGPGVAIVSTVPGGGYAAWDGTSMATPHVTGLVALLLAHHPDIKGATRATRLASLWNVLRACATPVVADPARGGAGLPALPPQLLSAAGASAPVGAEAAMGMPPGPAGATTPEGILLAELCRDPAILQAVMRRALELKIGGVI